MTTKVPKEKIDVGCDNCTGGEFAEIKCIEGYGSFGGIMIIGDTPSYYEDKSGKYFENSSSNLFARELHTVGIDITRCYLTKAIKCYQGIRKLNKKIIRNCRVILEQEIKKVEPKFILLLGGVALETLMGLTNLTKNRGKILDYNGIKVLATINPSIITRQPHQAGELRANLNYFSRMINGWELPKDFNWSIYKKSSELNKFKQEIEKSDAIAYDIETVGLDEYADNGEILMIGIATRSSCKILPINKSTIPFLNEVLREDTKYEKIAHNAKFDNRWLRSRGIFPTVTFDTFLAAYLLNVTIPHGLKYLAKTYLGASDYGESIEFKSNLTEEEFKNMANYCALDAYYTLKLYDITKKELQTDGHLWKVFKYIVMPGERILQEIENRGVYIDQEKLDAVLLDYKEKRDNVDISIKSLLPDKWKDSNINLNSAKQLGKLLYEDLNLPCKNRTPSGEYSTGKSQLLHMVDLHPIPRLILERRKYDKAIVGFLTPWKEFLKRDGRLHSTYNIAKTATGRLSAEKPNLQQVPRDVTVRSLIGTPQGKILIDADYSQLELRVAAFVANAKSMKDCYIRREDLHTKTAASVARITPDKVTKEQRFFAKSINFGFLYGMWWKSFKSYAFDSYGVVVTDNEAEKARKIYFETYPELAVWHEKQKEYVKMYKYVRTHTGRIRHLPDIDSSDKDLKSGAERQAINTVVQSFGSDITMLGMILIDKNIKHFYKDKAYLIGQIHDSILIECDEEVGNDVALLVKKCMESVPAVLEKYFGVKFDLPIVADVELGKYWGMTKTV